MKPATLPIIVLLAAMACAAGFVVSQEVPPREPTPEAKKTQVLLARKTDKAPALSAELTQAWKEAKPGTMRAAKGKGADVDVELRAMHDGTHVYLFARWADADESTVKGAWLRGKDAWEKQKGDEDRIAFAFNVNVANFAEKGCTALCHLGDMRTDKEGEKADLWHWKAGRGGLHGYCDDQNFKFAEDSGRVDDTGTSAYSDNMDKAGKAPIRRWKDDADKMGAFTEETSVAIDEKFQPKEGDTVPALILRKPGGSRGDIEAIGACQDGYWQVMFKRKLDTGNADDAKFEPGKDVAFTVAIFDNTGAKDGSEHKKTLPATLRLEP